MLAQLDPILCIFFCWVLLIFKENLLQITDAIPTDLHSLWLMYEQAGDFCVTLDSGIDVALGINIGPPLKNFRFWYFFTPIYALRSFLILFFLQHFSKFNQRTLTFMPESRVVQSLEQSHLQEFCITHFFKVAKSA